MEEPHAVKIIDINLENQILPKVEILEKLLLQDGIKDKKVCVVSVTGTCRQGKSFILNFFIRYLNVRYKKKIKAAEWLTPHEGPISGFQWRSGSQRHTVGILMWSEIFLAELSSGEEVAVIVLDTQGTFDNVSSVKECATIFALSTLISSFQVYNLKEGIKQYDFTHLQHFSGYGRLLVDDNEDNTSPFQNLLFLIRDWSCEDEHKFGAEGGQQYLNQELLIREDQAEDVVALKKNIKELFQKTKCFLLPHPGRAVASSKNFQGSLDQIDPEFKDYVQLLIPMLLSPENLALKTLNGEKIKVADLFRLIVSYSQQFQDGTMPELQSIFEASSEVHNTAVVDESVALYEKCMQFVKNNNYGSLDKESLEEEHQKNKSEALKYFRNKKKMGNKTMIENFERILIEKIIDKFLDFEEYNSLKKENEERLKEQEKLKEEHKLMHEEQHKMELQLNSLKIELDQAQQRRQLEERQHEELREERIRRREVEKELIDTVKSQARSAQMSSFVSDVAKAAISVTSYLTELEKNKNISEKTDSKKATEHESDSTKTTENKADPEKNAEIKDDNVQT